MSPLFHLFPIHTFMFDCVIRVWFVHPRTPLISPYAKIRLAYQIQPESLDAMLCAKRSEQIWERAREKKRKRCVYAYLCVRDRRVPGGHASFLFQLDNNQWLCSV